MNKSIELLIENENAIAKLYKQFSQDFSEYSDFWLRMSDDERSHAKWLTTFSEETEDKIKINTKRFSDSVIKQVADKVNDATAKYEQKKGDMLYALGVALDFEKSLLEKKFFEVFESDDDEIKEVLDDLRESTEKHRERVEKMLIKLKEKK